MRLLGTQLPVPIISWVWHPLVFPNYTKDIDSCLVVALVHGVDLPEGLDVAAGGQHDVLRAGVLRDKVRDVVHAVAVRHPDARVGAAVLPDLLWDCTN